MATNIPRITDAITGILPTPTAAASTMEWVWQEGDMLEVKNAQGVTGCIVTLTTLADVDGNAVADPTVTVAAGTNKRIGPFKSSIYRTVADGKVNIALDQTTSITVGVTNTPKST
jgi:hypothetical protein